MPPEGLQDLVNDFVVGQRRSAHRPMRRSAVGLCHRSFEEAVRRLDADDQPMGPMLACALVRSCLTCRAVRGWGERGWEGVCGSTSLIPLVRGRLAVPLAFCAHAHHVRRSAGIEQLSLLIHHLPGTSPRRELLAEPDYPPEPVWSRFAHVLSPPRSKMVGGGVPFWLRVRDPPAGNDAHRPGRTTDLSRARSVRSGRRIAGRSRSRARSPR